MKESPNKIAAKSIPFLKALKSRALALNINPIPWHTPGQFYQAYYQPLNNEDLGYRCKNDFIGALDPIKKKDTSSHFHQLCISSVYTFRLTT